MSITHAARAVLLAAVAIFAVVPAHAQSPYRFVTVVVTDEASRAPLPGVQVTLTGVADRSWETDAQGTVLVAVARGSQARLLLRRIGYAPLSITPGGAGDSTLVRATMTQAVATLDTTKVVGKPTPSILSGFDERRARANGAASYFTQEQIEKMMAIRTIDVVRRAVGARAIDSSGILLIASARGPKTVIGASPLGGAKGNDLAPCIMRVVVDGLMREWGFSLDGINPKDVYGIEVYPGPATMPVEFSGLRKDAMCGLVMIWSRRGP
jgi:hypothetical protein